MKKVVTLILCVLILGTCGSGIAANAVSSEDLNIGIMRASYYLASYDAWVTATGSGKIVVAFDVDATKRFNDVGALMIEVEQYDTASVKWVTVKTYYSALTSGMMGSNVATYGGTVTYSGTKGIQYRAKVTVYAGIDDVQNDYRTITTNSVTAT